eukprot:7204560-Pyramimonas_sp.AAC.1
MCPSLCSILVRSKHLWVPNAFPAAQDGSGGGAIHSYYSDAFIDFLKRGNAYTDFFPWQDDHYFLPRGPHFCPGMPPRGKRLRLATE